MGRYLEEFVQGEVLTTPARTVSEADVVNFAGVSGDFNPLHVDEEFCAQTNFGTRIAHGPLALAMVIGLMSRLDLIDGTTMGLLSLHWDFSAPVKIGDTIHALVKTTEVIPSRKPDRGRLSLEMTVKNQRDQTVQVGTITLLMRVRQADSKSVSASFSTSST